MFANHVRGNSVEFRASLIDRAPGASFPNSSVMRCTRPCTIVAERWCGLVTTLAMISVSRDKERSARRTPTMVAERVPRRTVLPMTLGSRLNAFFQRVGENGSASSVRSVVAHIEQAAERGVKTHHVEVSAADDAGADFAWFAEAIMVKPMTEKSPNSLMDLTLDLMSTISGRRKLALSTPMPWRSGECR